MELELNDLKEYIKQLMENRAIITDGEFKMIRMELAAIKALAEKTNGRVTKLEDEVYELEKVNGNHFNNCPNNKAIRELQDENLTRKSVKNWVITSVSIASGLIGLYFLIQKLFT